MVTIFTLTRILIAHYCIIVRIVVSPDIVSYNSNKNNHNDPNESSINGSLTRNLPPSNSIFGLFQSLKDHLANIHPFSQYLIMPPVSYINPTAPPTAFKPRILLHIEDGSDKGNSSNNSGGVHGSVVGPIPRLSHTFSFVSPFAFGGGGRRRNPFAWDMADEEDQTDSRLICLPLCSCKLDMLKLRSETTCRSLSYASLLGSIRNLTTQPPPPENKNGGPPKIFGHIVRRRRRSPFHTFSEDSNTPDIHMLSPSHDQIASSAVNNVGETTNETDARKVDLEGLWKRNRGRAMNRISTTTSVASLDNISPSEYKSMDVRDHGLLRSQSISTPSLFSFGANFIKGLNLGRNIFGNIAKDTQDTNDNHQGSYNISALTFTFNDIPRLSRDLFRYLAKLDGNHGLEHLEEIYFFFNKIRHIDLDVFDDFKNPNTDDNVKIYAPFMIKGDSNGVDNLKTQFDKKGVKILKIIEHHWHLEPKEYFDEFSSRIVEPFVDTLAELFISSPNLRKLALTSFQNFRKLETIILKSAALSSLSEHDESNNSSDSDTYYPTNTEIALPHALKDLRITSDVLNHIPKLVVVVNQEETRPEFRGGSEADDSNKIFLRKFTVSSRALNRLRDNDFSPSAFCRLEELHVVNSNLSHIHPDTFQSLADSLIHLDLHNNKLGGTLEGRAFRNLKKLQTLDLSGNELIVIPSGSFKNLPSLEFLSLKYNHIVAFGDEADKKGEVSTTYNSKDPDIFTESGALKTLLLKSNSLKNLPPTTVTAKLPKLELLDMSRNYIARLDAKSFAQNKRLERIDLSSNAIRYIDVRAFDGLESTLYDLKLYHNQLNDTLHPRTFSKLQNLTLLDISYNNLTTIDPDSFASSQDSLLYIDIAFNPWHCDCKMRKFRAWIENRISNLFFLHRFKARAILSRAKCASPPHMANVPLSFPHLGAFVCEEQTPWLFENGGRRNASDGESMKLDERNYSEEILEERHKAEEPKFIRDQFYAGNSDPESKGLANESDETQEYDEEKPGLRDNEIVDYGNTDGEGEAISNVNLPASSPNSQNESPMTDSEANNGNPFLTENSSNDSKNRKFFLTVLKKQQNMNLYVLKEIKNLYTLLAGVVGSRMIENITEPTTNLSADKGLFGNNISTFSHQKPQFTDVRIDDISNSMAYMQGVKSISKSHSQHLAGSKNGLGATLNLTLTVITLVLVLYLIYAVFCHAQMRKLSPELSYVKSNGSVSSFGKILKFGGRCGTPSSTSSNGNTLGSMKYSVNSLSSSIVQQRNSSSTKRTNGTDSNFEYHHSPPGVKSGRELELYRQNNEGTNGRHKDAWIVSQNELSSPSSVATDTPCLKYTTPTSPTNSEYVISSVDNSFNVEELPPTPCPTIAVGRDEGFFLGSHLSSSRTSLTSQHLPGARRSNGLTRFSQPKSSSDTKSASSKTSNSSTAVLNGILWPTTHQKIYNNKHHTASKFVDKLLHFGK